MCGIVGVIGSDSGIRDAFDVLGRLEYRGYDSAGIAGLSTGGDIEVRRAVGKLVNLKDTVAAQPFTDDDGPRIGHTRWATHGAATPDNAHPHATADVAVVHNGIIENFRELKAALETEGYAFKSQTDTEVVAVLIQSLRDKGVTAADAFLKAVDQLEGAYALAVIQRDTPDCLYGARAGSPLLLGYGKDKTYIASDAIGLGPLASQIQYLDEGDRCIVKAGSAIVFDQAGEQVDRPITRAKPGGFHVAKGNYDHFMQKEMFEQPEVVGQTLTTYLDFATGSITLPDMPIDLSEITDLTMIACGTSYHSVMVASYWVEALARLPVRIDIASEYRYRNPVVSPNGLAIFVSQSGETADTLAALRHVKAAGQKTLAIVNVENSSIAREADIVLLTHAGPEVAVASTKAFPCQLATLAVFTLALSKARGMLTPEALKTEIRSLEKVPHQIREALKLADQSRDIGAKLAKANYIPFVGRGVMQAIALEGALKLKEITYICAEGYAAGELKHGPISLIEEGVPAIGIVIGDQLQPKTLSNLEEIQARGGEVYLVLDQPVSIDNIAGSLHVTPTSLLAAPMIAVIPVQLLSYYTAVAKGTDIDQPRNLAKSVTVE